jgi:hypothetical protein
MRITPHSLRRITLAAILFLFVSIALWWGLWTLAASQFHASIDAWITSTRALGYTVAYDDRQSFGFPHHVVLRFTNLNWKNTDGITFHADRMDLSSLPWDKEVFDARFQGHVELAAPLDADNRTLVLGGDDGSARVVLTADGVWKLSRVELSHAQIGRAPDFLFHADRLAATAERPLAPPANHNQPGLTLTGEAQNVTLPADMPSPFGPKMAVLKASLRVMGDVPDFRRRDSVAAWNDAMGVVEFDNLHMEWGRLNLTAKGTLGFDDDLQPEGAFSSAISDQQEVLRVLAKQGFIPAHQAGMLNSALALFAKPAGGNAGIEVPITIQLEGLFLGPVRIFVFPEIEWPKAPGDTNAAVPVPALTAPLPALTAPADTNTALPPPAVGAPAVAAPAPAAPPSSP